MEVINLQKTKTQNKKGFTLVELVVTIAILAILAGIAIPVIAYQLDSSKRSKALTYAHTIEYAIKEAQAAQVAGDSTIYPNVNTKLITISEVVTRKGIKDAFTPINYKGVEYTPCWSDDKVYYSNGLKTIEGETLTYCDHLTTSSIMPVSVL